MTTIANAIQPVHIGSVPDDGTGEKLRLAMEKLNSNDALLAQLIAAITANADPDLDTLRKVADAIRTFYAQLNALPDPVVITANATAALTAAINTFSNAAALVIAGIPTPASIQAQINTAAAAVVAQLSPTNFYSKTDVDGLFTAIKGGADAGHDTLGKLAALVDANTVAVAAKPDLALLHAMLLAR